MAPTDDKVIEDLGDEPEPAEASEIEDIEEAEDVDGVDAAEGFGDADVALETDSDDGELELLEDEAAEVLLVDEAAELRAIRRAELTLDADAEAVRGDEFVCSSCFLVKRISQLADKRKLICKDCAG